MKTIKGHKITSLQDELFFTESRRGKYKFIYPKTDINLEKYKIHR